MELKNQVSNPELSNKLRKLFDELGTPKPSIYFRDCTKSKEDEIESWGNKPDWCEDNIPCYTVAELGEVVKNIPFSVLEKIPDEFILNDNNSDLTFSANFWAKLLIYILENKLI